MKVELYFSQKADIVAEHQDEIVCELIKSALAVGRSQEELSSELRKITTLHFDPSNLSAEWRDRLKLPDDSIVQPLSDDKSFRIKYSGEEGISLRMFSSVVLDVQPGISVQDIKDYNDEESLARACYFEPWDLECSTDTFVIEDESVKG